MNGDRRTCPRCGYTRTINPWRGDTDTCRDCREVEASIPPVRSGRPRMVQRYQWTPKEVLAAHNAYQQGRRDPWAREGRRIYSRQNKQRQRDRVEDEREAA